MNKISLAVLLLAVLNPFSFGQEKSVLQQASDLSQQRKYAQAIELYKKAIDEKPDQQSLREAYYGLGTSLKKLRLYDEATAALENAFKLSSDEKPFLSYGFKGQIKFEIAKNFFVKGDYETALAAIQAAKNHNYPMMDCTGSHTYERELLAAVSLEQLGKYREAAIIYLQLNDRRLIELYEASGQYNDLKSMIETSNERIAAELMQKYSWQRWKANETLPTHRLNNYLKIYELEKKAKFQELVDLASKPPSNIGSVERKIVVDLLVRNPKESLPLIRIALDKNDSPHRLIYEILALINSDESVAIIKEKILQSNNTEKIYRLIYVLSWFGERGEAVFNELQVKLSDEYLKKEALKIFQREQFTTIIDDEIKLPPVPSGAKLPTDLSIDLTSLMRPLKLSSNASVSK